MNDWLMIKYVRCPMLSTIWTFKKIPIVTSGNFIIMVVIYTVMLLIEWYSTWIILVFYRSYITFSTWPVLGLKGDVTLLSACKSSLFTHICVLKLVYIHWYSLLKPYNSFCPCEGDNSYYCWFSSGLKCSLLN